MMSGDDFSSSPDDFFLRVRLPACARLRFPIASISRFVRPTLSFRLALLFSFQLSESRNWLVLFKLAELVDGRLPARYGRQRDKQFLPLTTASHGWILPPRKCQRPHGSDVNENEVLSACAAAAKSLSWAAKFMSFRL